MKNKKVVIIFIIIVILVSILTGIYIIMSSYLFTKDGKIEDGHQMIINKIKEMKDYGERKKHIDKLLEENLITEKEAKELLEE